MRVAKKSGLGRGLESLLGEAAGEVGSSHDGVREVALSDVRVNPDQPRKSFDVPALDELTDSVRRNGVLQPILLRPHEGGYQIVAGERRYQAAKAAGLDTIPAVIRDIDDDMVLQLALIENLQRSDLNPMEEALGYQTLMSQNGFTQSELAQVLSKSRPAIANALRLIKLPAEVQEMVADGRLTAGHARAILAVEDDESRVALARRVVAQQLTVRQTEKLASSFSDNSTRKQKAKEPENQLYRDAAARLCDVLGAKVNVRASRGKRKVEIEFSDDRDLEALVNRLSGNTL